jgi:hypothetical protein
MDVMQTVPGKRIALLTVSLILSACGGGGGGGGTVPSAGTPVPTFTKWSNVKAGDTVQVDGLGQEVSGTISGTGGGFTEVKLLSPASPGYSVILTFDQALELTRLTLKSPSTLVSFDGATFTDLTLAPGPPPQFVGAGSPITGNAAILANPIDLGWEYQSFGVWETASTDGRTFGAMSVGAPTAGTAIPGSGTATFTGYAAGSYVSAAGTGATALADLKVIADFGPARSLDFSTTNTQTSENWVTVPFTPNDGLNLTGTLTYAPGTNSFAGDLTTTSGLSGPSTGQFYGPKAEELGGVFFLQGSGLETYAGAYGAKQTP